MKYISYSIIPTTSTIRIYQYNYNNNHPTWHTYLSKLNDLQVLLFIIVFILNQQQHSNQLQFRLIIQIANDHTNYSTTISNNIITSKFTIKSIDNTETNKCQYKPTVPTGASIFSRNTINKNQLYFQQFNVHRIEHMI